ncbi:hypothetical protein A3C95_01560 [Candidatus Kaiserbacteria bacterium RIFCSPHIGHO2_02_FULL_56_30]|nr:MAG: hypothetical protein A3C95_01560 [Candidatus Kaiserbacteria bacterium RIFCSPHIGHO2_02_FULL_56_30]
MNRNRGFALLVAVIFVSVVLALGTALSSLGYKQQILSSGGARSQYAFYAADAALECALTDTQKELANDPYAYQNYSYGVGKPPPTCGSFDTQAVFPFQELCYNTGSCLNQRVSRKRFEIAFANPLIETSGTGALCADITVYETDAKPAGTTYVFSQGYDVPCDKVGTTNRIVVRGIFARF